jgi:hypothetical protein
LLSNSGLEDQVQFYHITGGADYGWNSTLKLRDNSGWYHLVFVYNSPSGTGSERMRGYVNGVEISSFATDYGTLPQNQDSFVNHTNAHNIGKHVSNDSTYYDGYMSQVYLVDGQALSPTDFGFTDGLTNTWRPKKYTGTYGTNGFYLPMDGNSPIGEDKSGNGNNFTPAGFGGSNSIEKATGALPILNTTNGGNVATVGVRTDSDSSGLGLALPLVGTVNDVSNQVNNGSTTKTITKGNNVDADTQRYNFYGGSHRFNGSTDYLDVAASSDFALGTGDFTVECWIYSGVNSLDTYYRRIYMTDGPTGNATGNFQISITPTSGVINLWENTGQLDVDGTTDVTNSRWNHIAAVRSGTTLKLYVNGVEELSTTYSTSVTANSGSPRPRIGNYDGGSGGGDFDGYMQDLRVYKGVAKYTSNFIPASTNPDVLPDTPSGVSGSSKLAKIIDGAVSFDGSGDYLSIAATDEYSFGTGDFTIELFIYHNTLNAGGNTIIDFRNAAGNTDAGALWKTSGGEFGWYVNGSNRVAGETVAAKRWYHLALVRNSGTTSLYVDGTSVGSFSDSFDYATKSGRAFVGALADGTGTLYLDGFISNLRIIKGTALYTSNFTPPTRALTNVTNTKLLCCQSTTSATAAAVAPGSITANGDPAATNFNPFTTDINAVRGQESGYCVLSQASTFNGDGSDIQEGGLKFECPASGDASTRGTIGIPAGFKFYMEARYNEVAGAGGQARLGIAQVQQGYTKSGTGMWSIDFRGSAGTIQKDDEGALTTLTGDPVTGDIVGIKVDLASGEFRAHRNGIYYDGGSALMTGIPNVESDFFAALDGGVNRNDWDDINFGQKPWKYPPEDGYQPLCLANLPRPTEAAVRPDKYFKTLTYAGNGATNTPITGLGFKPDLVWVKGRTATENSNITDSVRGAPKYLISSATSAEQDYAGKGIISFDSDGFTVFDENTGGYGVSHPSRNYVAWCWKAGGAAVSNTDGSITSQVSANRDSGFSIVTYTGTGSAVTVGHGLGDAPAMVIVKDRSTNPGYSWYVYHQKLTSSSYFLRLNTTGAETFSNDPFNGTAPTSTVFSVGGENVVNTHNYVAYCFAEVESYSKFGSYIGNGVNDGPFVFLGFRPALILTKRTNSTSNWVIQDSTRQTYNPSDAWLRPNTSDAEGTTSPDLDLDFLSNGFKVRNNGTDNNISGSTYIFMAFAEAPTNNLYGGQANAR